MNPRVVLADDAPFMREVMRHILSKHEIELVGEASNGQEVIELALKVKPDLILMDLVMPIKSGITATKEILAQNPSIKIIACSTMDQHSMVLKAIEAGCCDYITKPFESLSVIHAIQSSLEKKMGVQHV